MQISQETKGEKMKEDVFSADKVWQRVNLQADRIIREIRKSTLILSTLLIALFVLRTFLQ